MEEEKLIFEIAIKNNVICRRHWILENDITFDNFVDGMNILKNEFNVIENPNKKIFTDDINVYFKTKDEILFHHIIESKRTNYKINIKHRLDEIRLLLVAEKSNK